VCVEFGFTNLLFAFIVGAHSFHKEQELVTVVQLAMKTEMT